MATDLQMFTSSYDMRRFVACDSWTQISWPVLQRDLLITTTRATIVAHAFLVITRQLLQLERCSNPLRIQHV